MTKARMEELSRKYLTLLKSAGSLEQRSSSVNLELRI